MHTQSGLKPIEQIRIGEMVWARSEDGTGAPGYRRVNDTFSFEPKPIFEVALRAVDGREETYRATGNHPFWIENSSDETGWTAAEDLRAGDTLRLADSNPATIITLTDTGTEEPVYNMEVDAWHTYHIGKLGFAGPGFDIYPPEKVLEAKNPPRRILTRYFPAGVLPMAAIVYTQFIPNVHKFGTLSFRQAMAEQDDP